jgi:hypothetical protein
MLAWMNSANCTKQELVIAVKHIQISFRTSVTSFTREGHEGMCVQSAGLVVFGFEDGGASHGGFRAGDEGEVLARDS